MMQPGDYGDRAGEHLRIARGRYSAWPHVILGFLVIAFAIAGILALSGALVLEPPGRPPYFSDRRQRDTAGMVLLVASACVGLSFAWLVFRDRWKCVEAFTSRFCSGVMNLSLLYAPLIAAGYALARGARKLSGDERPHGDMPMPMSEQTVDALDPLGGRRASALGPAAIAAIAVIGVVVVAALLVLIALRLSPPKIGLPLKSGAPCPDNRSYCQLPLALTTDGKLAEAGLSLRLEPGLLEVSPQRSEVCVTGTLTHQNQTELQRLVLGLRLYDDAGAEMAVVPIKVHQDFMPPMRSGDSGPWYVRAPVTSMPRRAVLILLEQRAVPAPATPDEGSEMPIELPPSAPRHFKLTAFARSRELRQLGLKTSGKMLVAVRNDGEGVVRELELKLVPRAGVGRDLGPTYAERVAYGHMPPMYPGERRVVALSYYVMGQVVEERLVATDIK